MNRSSESGAAIVYILIAIALLAALSFAVTRNNRASVMSLSEDQLKMETQSVYNFAEALLTAVQKLELRGCAADELSAQNSCGFVGANPSAPPDGHCDIFRPAGGGIQCQKSPYVDLNNARWELTYRRSVRDVGRNCGSNPCSELTVNYAVPLTVCQKINEREGLPTDPPPVSTVILLAHSGGLGNSTWDGNTFPGGGDAVLHGKLRGCYRHNMDAGGNCTGGHCGYYFYQVLIPR